MKRQKEKRTRSIGSLSWAEREEMIKESLLGNYAKVEIWKKYTGQSVEHGKMLRWMRMLGYSDKIEIPIKRHLSSGFIRQEQPVLATKDNPQDPRDLQKHIKELERQLENAQLKAEGYELMIEIAEKELKIPIRKKSDTKYLHLKGKASATGSESFMFIIWYDQTGLLSALLAEGRN